MDLRQHDGGKAEGQAHRRRLRRPGPRPAVARRASGGERLPGPSRPARGGAPRFRELFADGVVDLRRALDYLATRADVDTSRVGLLGYELGGNVAFCLMAVEPRLRAAIACVTPAVDDGPALLAPQNYAPRVRVPF